MHWLVEEKLKLYSMLIYFHYWCLYDGVMRTIRVLNSYFFFGMLLVLICDLSPNFNRYDFIIKLSWVKLCRQLFLFKLSFANYFLCYEPCIILYGYLCSSKLFCVLLLILQLSFKRYIYDVFGRSNCFNTLMTKKLHLWTIRRLQGT